MEIRVLGSLQVVNDAGVPVGLTAPRERALLELLVLHRDHPVTGEHLETALWTTEPPKTARKTLQTYVLHLRRLLAENEGVSITHDHGYRLLTPPLSIDADRFEYLVTQSLTLLAEGNAEAARAALDQAVVLWRGEPFSEIGNHAAPAVSYLRQLRTTAILKRFESMLARGEHLDAIPALEAHVADQPLEEGFWLLLGLALYRAGRTVDALHTYQRARAALTSELGVEPGADLRWFEQAVLHHDVVLHLSLPQVPPTHECRSETWEETAARMAMAAFRPDDAGVLLSRAIDIVHALDPPDAERATELEVELGNIFLAAGKPALARASFTRAFSAAPRFPRSEAVAAAAVALASFIEAGETDPALAAAVQALLESNAVGGPRADLLAALCGCLENSTDDVCLVRDAAAEALALARLAGDSRRLVRVVRMVLFQDMRPSVLRHRVELADELVSRAVDSGDPNWMTRAYVARIFVRYEAGDITGARRDVGVLERLADVTDLPLMRARALAFRAGLSLVNGRIEEAAELTEAAFVLGSELDLPDVVSMNVMLEFVRRWMVGGLEDLIDLLAEYSRSVPTFIGPRVSLAIALARAGELGAARRELRTLRDYGFEQYPRDQNWLSCLAGTAELIALVGGVEHAPALASILSEFPAGMVPVGEGVTCAGAVDYFRGRLAMAMGDGSEALRLLERALDVYERNDMPWHAADTTRWLAELRR